MFLNADNIDVKIVGRLCQFTQVVWLSEGLRVLVFIELMLIVFLHFMKLLLPLSSPLSAAALLERFKVDVSCTPLCESDLSEEVVVAGALTLVLLVRFTPLVRHA